jgi:hypothetical protein
MDEQTLAYCALFMYAVFGMGATAGRTHQIPPELLQAA